jgi:hypothetical protein
MMNHYYGIRQEKPDSQRGEYLQRNRAPASDSPDKVHDAKHDNRERDGSHEHKKGDKKYLADNVVGMSEQLLRTPGSTANKTHRA